MTGDSWGRGFKSVLVVAVAVVVLSCTHVLNDLDTGSVDHVRVSPDSMDLPIGTNGALQAFPLDASEAFHPGASTAWVSSDPSIVTVDDTGGLVGVGAGTATITATALGIDGTARVRVGPAPLIALAADSVHFDAQAGQPSPAAQTIAITNGGGLTLSALTVGAIDYGTGPQSWLIPQFDVTTAPATLTLTPATGAITQAGTYIAIVPIAAPGAGNSPQNITVVVDVVPGPPTTYQMAISAGNGQVVQAGSAVPAPKQARPPATINADLSGHRRPRGTDIGRLLVRAVPLGEVPSRPKRASRLKGSRSRSSRLRGSSRFEGSSRRMGSCVEDTLMALPMI